MKRNKLIEKLEEKKLLPNQLAMVLGGGGDIGEEPEDQGGLDFPQGGPQVPGGGDPGLG